MVPRRAPYAAFGGGTAVEHLFDIRDDSSWSGGLAFRMALYVSFD